jgi:hypothetical protein
VRIHDSAANAVFQRLLDKAKAMIDDTRYAGTGITIVEEAYARAKAYYTVDASGNPVANPDTLRVWLCPIMKDLDDALVRAQEEIDNILGNGS